MISVKNLSYGNLVKVLHPDLTFREMSYDNSHLILAKNKGASPAMREKSKLRKNKIIEGEILDSRAFYVFKKRCENAAEARLVIIERAWSAVVF